MENFIDDTYQQEDGVSFYRQLNPENVEHYHKLPNQTRNRNEAVNEDKELYSGTEDTQPELYDPEDREILLVFINFPVLKSLSTNSKRT